MSRCIISLLLFLILSSDAFPQTNKRSLSGYTSFPNDNVFLYPTVIGREAIASETGFRLIGIEYSYKLRKKLSINAGVEFGKHNITVSYWMDNPFLTQLSDNKGELDMLTFPFSLRLFFLKYFFVHGGFIVDLQTKNNLYNQFSGKNDVVNDQSGIGSILGIGINYQFKKRFSIYTGLNNEIHGLIFFKKSNFKKRLGDMGLRTGIGYRF